MRRAPSHYNLLPCAAVSLAVRGARPLHPGPRSLANIREWWTGLRPTLAQQNTIQKLSRPRRTKRTIAHCRPLCNTWGRLNAIRRPLRWRQESAPAHNIPGQSSGVKRMNAFRSRLPSGGMRPRGATGQAAAASSAARRPPMKPAMPLPARARAQRRCPPGRQ